MLHPAEAFLSVRNRKKKKKQNEAKQHNQNKQTNKISRMSQQKRSRGRGRARGRAKVVANEDEESVGSFRSSREVWTRSGERLLRKPGAGPSSSSSSSSSSSYPLSSAIKWHVTNREKGRGSAEECDKRLQELKLCDSQNPKDQTVCYRESVQKIRQNPGVNKESELASECRPRQKKEHEYVGEVAETEKGDYRSRDDDHFDDSCKKRDNDMLSTKGAPMPEGPPMPQELKKMFPALCRRFSKRQLLEYFPSRIRGEKVVKELGTAGRNIFLVTNHVKLVSSPNWTAHQYRVDFKPVIERKSWREALLKDSKILSKEFIFDGMGLYSLQYLPDEETTCTRIHPGNPKETVLVIVKRVTQTTANSVTAIHLLNVLFRDVMKIIDMQQVGRHYYSFKDKVSVDKHRFDVLPGYATSILPYENDILLQFDVRYKILHKDTLLEQFYDIWYHLKTANKNIVDEALTKRFEDTCARKFFNQIVMTKYNNKTYRISSIAWDEHPTDKFETKDGMISYLEYYEKNYGKNASEIDPHQPLLVINPKARDIRRGMTEDIKLLPQLCVLTGLSEETTRNQSVMQDLSRHTRIGPSARYARYQKFLARLRNDPQVTKRFKAWDLEFADCLLELKARQLPPVKIYMKSTEAPTPLEFTQRESEWTRSMKKKSLLKAQPLENWCIVFPARDSSKTEECVRNLLDVSVSLGARMSRPHMFRIADDRDSSYQRCLENDVRKISGLQLVVVVLSSAAKNRYDAVKKFLCLNFPVPSQCVVAKTLGKGCLRSIATKIALQMQCKLGGEIWACSLPKVGTPYMVVGIDTYHDSSEKGRSACGFVASMNQNATLYFSAVSFQTPNLELANGLQVFMTKALTKFYDKLQVLPSMIMVYRDGVGDGQLDAVKETEIQAILNSFADLGQNYNPSLFFVVVKKRINQRFFEKALDQHGASNVLNLGNPPPGTVVDTVVTRSEWFDFFLVSQSVKQGTVTPTHYNVIYNTTKWNLDRIQQWTYMMTHLYYNWPGTIRVPASCQYAHKLAFLVGQSLHKAPVGDIQESLFYL